MSYKVSKLDIWTGEIDDQVGGLAARLGPIADAGVDLQFVLARRQPHLDRKGVVFLGPITGAKGTRAAAGAGLAKATDIAALRVEGANKPGDCARAARIIANAGINLRGLSASVLGRNYTMIIAFDSVDDAAKAAKLLRAGPKKRK